MASTIVALGDVAEFIRGINFKPDDVVPVGTPDTVACFRTSNVQAVLDLSDVWAVSNSFVKRPEQIVQPGDILISSANSWNLLGKCCWIPELPWRSSFGGFVSVLRPNPERVDPRFLYRWFSFGRIQAVLRSFGQRTTNISNLNIERCRQLRLPLPPLVEQRRIAAILDKADALRAKRRAALDQLNGLTQSIFLEMFGPLLANAAEHAAPLRECAEVVSGVTKGRAFNGRSTVDVPYLRVANVQAGFLDLTEMKTIHALPNEVEALRLIPGDVVLTEGGDFDKLGRGAVWTGQIENCIHQNHVFRVRFNPTVLPEYFHEYLQTIPARAYFLRCAKKTTNLASINMTQLRALPVVVPNVGHQHEFVHRARAGRRLADRMNASLRRWDTLFASLQHQAFSGALSR